MEVQFFDELITLPLKDHFKYIITEITDADNMKNFPSMLDHRIFC